MNNDTGEKEDLLTKERKMEFDCKNLQISQVKLVLDLIAACIFSKDADDRYPGTIAITGFFSASLGFLKLIRKSRLKLKAV